jgi:hypothetical protein
MHHHGGNSYTTILPLLLTHCAILKLLEFLYSFTISFLSFIIIHSSQQRRTRQKKKKMKRDSHRNERKEGKEGVDFSRERSE